MPCGWSKMIWAAYKRQRLLQMAGGLPAWADHKSK